MEKGSIGIFDSGLGGFSVLSELKRHLPDARFVYLADTARIPYGTKSPEILEHYAFENIRFLMKTERIQLLVIACGTISSLMSPKLFAHVPIPIVGMIEPCVQALIKEHPSGSIAVLATKATVASKAYTAHLQSYGFQGQVTELACQVCVALVEEGWLNNKVADLTVEYYVQMLPPIEQVILGCTHFPLLMPLWKKHLPSNVIIIDPAVAVTKTVKGLLKDRFQQKSSPDRYMVTGDPKQFADMAKQIFGDISVEKVVLS